MVGRLRIGLCGGENGEIKVETEGERFGLELGFSIDAFIELEERIRRIYKENKIGGV